MIHPPFFSDQVINEKGKVTNDIQKRYFSLFFENFFFDFLIFF